MKTYGVQKRSEEVCQDETINEETLQLIFKRFPKPRLTISEKTLAD